MNVINKIEATRLVERHVRSVKREPSSEPSPVITFLCELGNLVEGLLMLFVLYTGPWLGLAYLAMIVK
jgi:hypothetical protein